MEPTSPRRRTIDRTIGRTIERTIDGDAPSSPASDPTRANQRRTTDAVASAPDASDLLQRDLYSRRDGEIRERAQAMFARFCAWRSVRRGPTRAGRALSADSVQTYSTMWALYEQFCLGYDLLPHEIDEGSLEAFLAGRRSRLSPRQGLRSRLARRDTGSTHYAYRLLRLIAQVLALHAAQTGERVSAAPATMLEREPYKSINAPENVALPPVLRDEEVAALVNVCSLPLGEPVPGAPLAWFDVRDNTAVLLLLGAGLSPGELRALRMADVEMERGQPMRLAIAGSVDGAAREVLLEQPLRNALRYWLACRRRLIGAPVDMGLEDGPLLVASASGRPWSESGMLKALRKVFERAGIGRVAATGYVLRHTFVLRSLKVRRRDPRDVARQIGVLDHEKLVKRYQGLSVH
jgi:integrase